MAEDIKTARPFTRQVDEIGDQVATLEQLFEQGAGVHAPGKGQRPVSGLKRQKIGRDLEQQQVRGPLSLCPSRGLRYR